MLAEAARLLGLETVVLAERGGEPAVEVANRFEQSLDRLFAQSALAVFENEFVDCELLKRAAGKYGVRFVPGLDAIAVIQDKLGQKRLLERLGVPTAAWTSREEKEAAPEFLSRAAARFPKGYVLKWSRLGYDGKGVLLPSPRERELGFMQSALERGIPVFAEEKIAYSRELAMIAAFSTTGRFVHWPLVISEQREGICRTIQGPAIALGVRRELEALAAQACEKIAKEMQLFGVFALEFFETESGELRVNEIAPRVHNSGHYTQDASRSSQFENHWRAVLGLPLGAVDCAKGFAMVNLIGPPDVSAAVRPELKPEEGQPGKLHWYGKNEIRPGRKMGHLNGTVVSASGVPGLVKALEERRLKWESRLRKSEQP
jgi:5-(carboxyamino)imidazole ribonucleotide synthase